MPKGNVSGETLTGQSNWLAAGAGAVLAPQVLGNAGPLISLGVPLAMAYKGSGAVKAAGQGATFMAAVSLMNGLLSGQDGGLGLNLGGVLGGDSGGSAGGWA